MQNTPPPPTRGSPTAFRTPLDHYASDSNIADSPQPMQEAFSFSNIAARSSRMTKRKSDDITRSEILDLFTSLKEDQDLKFSAILNSINDVKVSMDCMSRKYDEALQRIDLLEESKKSQDTKIQFLENKIEILERYTRGTSIELRNVPQTTKETKEDLRNIIQKTAEALRVPLDSSSDIKDVYRINSKSEVKPIIADFTTVFARDSFLTSYKNFNKVHSLEKLSTVTLCISGPSKPVYISENLTQKDRKLYFLAREFAKSYGYAFCWTSFGRIYLRKEEGSPQVRIFSEGDLDNLKPQ